MRRTSSIAGHPNSSQSIKHGVSLKTQNLGIRWPNHALQSTSECSFTQQTASVINTVMMGLTTSKSCCSSTKSINCSSTEWKTGSRQGRARKEATAQQLHWSRSSAWRGDDDDEHGLHRLVSPTPTTLTHLLRSASHVNPPFPINTPPPPSIT